MMEQHENIALAGYRLEKAKNDLKDARKSFAEKMYETAANRAYYAIFHAARAVLILNGQDYKRHSGVISFFRKDYIKTGILDESLSEIIKNAFELRTESDYSDFFIISKEEIEKQIEDAAFFVAEIEKYLKDKITE